ncbi:MULTISPECIES: DUF4054 domain-containing protein [unclassified Acinetobacter]|uniref:DUF4054 domain-containing protein n=1 Tax=unclassified Acinetobacter TaxID=196816 RepID=UPI0025769BAB|nr:MULTISPECIES: DUF4054 domain-containing protein [unclassified Acinetobacter]MDM1765726.1 DUF4054 domain-containing protein [Acinetobacter sp. 226-1]MDM1769387.1 DUF4054 domain-containing protein [Acinetobacter sp. 226-4]
MDLQTFREKFKSDSQLYNASEPEIQDALEEAELVVSVVEFGQLKARAVGLYAAHILKVQKANPNGTAISNASNMSIAGQSIGFSRSAKETFYDQSIYGQRYLALKNSIPIDNQGINPNNLRAGAFVV